MSLSKHLLKYLTFLEAVILYMEAITIALGKMYLQMWTFYQWRP
jgi:hypothetical protein